MLADILVGPIIRRLTPKQLVLWWVSPFKCEGNFHCFTSDKISNSISNNKGKINSNETSHSASIRHEDKQEPIFTALLNNENLTTFRVGKKAVVHLLDVSINLPVDTYIEYDLQLISGDNTVSLIDIIPTLVFNNKKRPSFIIQQNINNLLHGSCRNPHNASDDSLLAGERLVEKSLTSLEQRPTLLMMSGDQVYADHVAGVTLYAIHQVITLLGLNDENLTDAHLAEQGITSGDELYQYDEQYFQREQLLPYTTSSATWLKQAKKKPIFTSTNAHNHLITFAENMAMNFLMWSPTLWQQVELEGFNVPAKFQMVHQQEVTAIKNFISGLDKVQRLLAHIPTYMIFDDHDVTDDWNLTAGWEQAAYENPLSKRIIGNSLFAYWLCQGWGNDPKQFEGNFLAIANTYEVAVEDEVKEEKCTLEKISEAQDTFIEYLFKFSHWQYTLDSQPKLVVLDSRTRRWRSERSLDEPSGLMDWEALCELQQELIGHDAIILVSPAPIFGVKVIETIQRMATIFGHPLAVDAENWMAHRGAASTLLNIFKHPKTPQHFVILSGDVHYSFVYDVEIRFRDHSPQIWQITSSGIKNQFPQPLIGLFDRMNHWLYGSYSPLNFFTKRRSMRIKSRKLIIDGQEKNLLLGHQRLQPKSGLGYVELNDDGSPQLIADLHCDGTQTVFTESDEELMP